MKMLTVILDIVQYVEFALCTCVTYDFERVRGGKGSDLQRAQSYGIYRYIYGDAKLMGSRSPIVDWSQLTQIAV